MNVKKVSVLIAIAAIFSLASYACAAENTPNLTEVKQKIMEESIASSESSFRQMYRQIWSEQKLDEKIAPAVSNVMTAQIEEMMLGTRRFRLSYNVGDVIGKIVKNSVAALQPDIDIFVNELNKKYNAVYPEEAVRVFKNFAAEGVATSDNPMVKAVVKLISADVLANNGSSLKKKITASLPEGVKIAEGIEALPTVQRRTGWDGFKDSTLTYIDIFTSVSEKVEDTLVSSIKDYFVKGAPVVMWEGAVSDVKKGLEIVCEELITMLKDASEMASTPEAQQLIEKHDLNN